MSIDRPKTDEEKARRVQELLFRTKKVPLDTKPFFNQRFAARFRYIRPVDSWIRRYLALPVVKWLILPAVAGGAIYFGTRYFRSIQETPSNPTKMDSQSTGTSTLPLNRALPSVLPSSGDSSQKLEVPSDLNRPSQNENLRLDSTKTQGSSGNAGTTRTGIGIDKINHHGESRDSGVLQSNANERNNDSRFRGIEDLRGEWVKANDQSVVLLSWKTLPDEPIQAIEIEASLGDLNHFQLVAHLKPDVRSYQWSGAFTPGSSIYFRALSLFGGKIVSPSSPVIELKTEKISAPNITSVIYNSSHLDFKWTSPSSQLGPISIIIEINLDGRGFMPLATLPAASGSYSWPMAYGTWQSVCINNSTDGCTTQAFRMKYDGGSGKSSPYSFYTVKPLEGLNTVGLKTEYCRFKASQPLLNPKYDLDHNGIFDDIDWALYYFISRIALPSLKPNCP